MPFRPTLLLAASILCSAPLLAETPKPPQMDPKILQGLMNQGMPVAEHARLRDYVGTWATHQTDWLPTGKTWNEADGTATCHLTLGGRFVQEDYTSALDGHPFHAMGLMGFDRQAKSYILLWMDDLNTGFVSLAGTFDGTGRVLTLLGALPHAPLAWLAVVIFLAGLLLVFSGLKAGRHLMAFLGSGAFILGILAATAACVYPVMLKSTLDPAYSLTAQNALAGTVGLHAALGWWFIAFLLVLGYYTFLFRFHRGKVKAAAEGEGY